MPDNKSTILVVDDHEIFRNRLAKSLRNRGWEVLTASRYEEALQEVAKSPPSRAIVDLRMPGRNGLELVQELVRRYSEMSCIVLTGYGSISTAVDAMKVGAINYLSKPVDVDDILRAFGDDVSTTELTAPSLARVEWEHIQRVLKDCDGNITRAAKILKIHRRTLQRKLESPPY